jgi:protein MpaA
MLLTITFSGPLGCAAPDRSVTPTPVTNRRDPPPAGAAGVPPREVFLGRSMQDRPITMHRFGTRGPSLLIFGGIHGSEPTSTALAQRFLDHLRDHPELYADRQIAVLPAANPDGLLVGSRTNANGVDCNRNFPTANWRPHRRDARRHGPTPGSEPETRAILRAIEMTQPVRILSIHSTGSFPKCNNFDGPAEALAAAMAERNGYPVTPDLGYATPGSFGTWAGDERKIPTITLELDRDEDAATAWRDNREALIAFVRH